MTYRETTLLETATKEAERFLVRARKLQQSLVVLPDITGPTDRQLSMEFPKEGVKHDRGARAAAHRASIDLSRALIEFRRSRTVAKNVPAKETQDE